MRISKSLAKEIEEKHGKGWAIVAIALDDLANPEPMTLKDWALEYLPLPILFAVIFALAFLLMSAVS